MFIMENRIFTIFQFKHREPESGTVVYQAIYRNSDIFYIVGSNDLACVGERRVLHVARITSFSTSGFRTLARCRPVRCLRLRRLGQSYRLYRKYHCFYIAW